MKIKPILEYLEAKTKMNHKGVLGMEDVKAVMLFLLVLAVVAIALFLALTNLNSAGLFTAGSQPANDTSNIINNITSGTTSFFKNVPTIFTILGAVVIITAVILILIAVQRISQSAGGFQ
jgi:hypothetical protein